MEEDEPIHEIVKVKVRWKTEATWEHTFEVHTDTVREALALEPPDEVSLDDVMDYLCEGDFLDDASESMWARQIDGDLEVKTAEITERRVVANPPPEINPLQIELPLTEESA